MKTIWFVYPYGPLPSEKSLECRYARFARVLSKHGYNCIWWTANFDHGTKKRRSVGWKTIDVCDGFQIILVPTPSYKNNISIGRVRFERVFSKNLEREIARINAPDLIMTPGTGLTTAFRPIWPYMNKNNVPVIYDIMDVHMINSYMHKNHRIVAPLVKLVTKIINKREQPFYDNVVGVTALGRGQLDIAKNRTGNRTIPSCLVYNGIYVDEFRRLLNSPCVISLPPKGQDEIWCVYAGSLGPSYDIETVIKCADLCYDNNDKIKFIIAGSGPFQEAVKEASERNSKIVYIGTHPADKLIPVYKNCDIGLCTYAAFSTVDMPDKFYDYCAAGLAVVNSLQGEIKSHISENNLGKQYIAGDSMNLYQVIKYLTSENTIKNCKEKAYRIGALFDLSKQLEPMINIIDTIVNK